MKFEKKLIIMTGKDCKGTVSLERNAYGTFATVNTYNAPDLKSGEYGFGIKSAEGNSARALGSLGRIMTRFKLDGADLNNCHCFLYDSDKSRVVMYGTTSDTRLWEGNLLDGIGRDNIEKEATINNIAAQKTDNALPNYSVREKTDNMFWDILPSGSSYSDGAIAEVNYYPSNLSFESAATKNAAQTAASSGIKELPSDLEKRYLYRYRKPQSADILQSPNSQRQNPNEQSTQSKTSAVQKPIEQNTSTQTPKSQFSQASHFQDIGARREIRTLESEEIRPAPPASFTVEQAVAEKRTQSRFYEQAAKQIDELFRTNARFGKLEELMPGTKWVRVEYNSAGKFYVVGLIGSKPDYLCYGVPGTYSSEPPLELDGYCAWLPLEATEPQSKGFWLMYQDAVTGESVPKPR